MNTVPLRGGSGRRPRRRSGLGPSDPILVRRDRERVHRHDLVREGRGIDFAPLAAEFAHLGRREARWPL